MSPRVQKVYTGRESKVGFILPFTTFTHFHYLFVDWPIEYFFHALIKYLNKYHHFTILRYLSILKEGENIGLEDLDSLQFELEALLSKAVVSINQDIFKRINELIWFETKNFFLGIYINQNQISIFRNDKLAYFEMIN